MALATGDPYLGEEVAAEAFALALLHWPRVSRMDAPSGWVYTTALNQVRRSWRRRQLEQRYLDRQRVETVPPPEPPDTALWQAVHTLAPRARTAIALRYVADLSEQTVADAMNVSRGTVATTLSRARRQLAGLLEPVRNGDLS
jgi:RNA polymerase sigma-70 factor (ECF subfamily)